MAMGLSIGSIALDREEATLAAERARLVRLCARLTGDAGAAEDLAQETLLVAFQHEQALRAPAKRAQWLSGIARNLCLHWDRRKGLERARSAYPYPRPSDDAFPPDEADARTGDVDLEGDLERAGRVGVPPGTAGVPPAHGHDDHGRHHRRACAQRLPAGHRRSQGVRRAACMARTGTLPMNRGRAGAWPPRLTLPRRWAASPTLVGTFAVLCLLPQVSRGRTALLAAGVLAATALPLAAVVVTGMLVGAIPPAVRGGLDSPAGRRALSLLVVAGVLIVAERLLGPFLAALAGTFGRAVDRRLQERVMAAVGGPSGVAHLEDPAVLDLIETAQGLGANEVRPGAAVTALASLLPSWFQALGSALILAAFHWWLALVWVALWPLVTY